MSTELNHPSSSMRETTPAPGSRPARSFGNNIADRKTLKRPQAVGLPEPAPTYSNGPKVPPPSKETNRSSPPGEEGLRPTNRLVLDDPQRKHRFRMEDIWV